MANPYRGVQPNEGPAAAELDWRLGVGAGAAAAAWSLVLRALAQVLYAFEVGVGGPSFVLWIEGAASAFAVRAALLLLHPRNPRLSWRVGRAALVGFALADLLSLVPVLIESESFVGSWAFGVHLAMGAIVTLALVGVFVALVPRGLLRVSAVCVLPLAPLAFTYLSGAEIQPVEERWLLGSLVLGLVAIGFVFAWVADRRRVTFAERWLDRTAAPARRVAMLLGFGSGNACVLTPKGEACEFADVPDAGEWLRNRHYVEDE